MDRLTDAELEELARAEGAAPSGEWEAHEDTFGASFVSVPGEQWYLASGLRPEVARVIAAARNALPALLAEIRERRDAERWRDAREEPPDSDRIVLAASPDFQGGVGAARYAFGAWWWVEEELPLDMVTRWREMPAPGEGS
jgi:hypothetical protein